MADITPDQSTTSKRTAVKSWLGSGSINLFGRPLSGKDTQARLLAEWLGAHIISGGAILRNSPIPEHVQALLDKGELAPTADYLGIVTPYLQRQEFVGSPLVLSMVGRWHGEEAVIVEACKQAEHEQRAVVLIEVSEDTVLQRHRQLQQRQDRIGRRDDTLEALRIRLREYENKSVPVIDFYREQGLLITVNGEQSEEHIAADILEGLYQKASN